MRRRHPGNNRPLGTFEPYTTGEFSNYPKVWKPVYYDDVIRDKKLTELGMIKAYEKISNLYRSGNSPINIEKEDISYRQGDYYSENGLLYKFEIAGDKYEVGYIIVVEDDDTWAQAESHEYNVCSKNGYTISSLEMTKIVDSYLQLEREHKLNQLGIG